MTQKAFAQDDGCYGGACAQGGCEQQAQDCCAPPDKNMGDCYCLYAHYEPCYYKTWRCEWEDKYTQKKCCRYVPQYYQKKCCRYVPQYYYETCCRQCPEYYYVTQCKKCPKYVCDYHCKYVPRYYYKHTCMNPCDTDACAPCGR